MNFQKSISANRLLVMKQKVQLAEASEKFSDLDLKMRSLREKREVYERSSHALLDSALSVHFSSGATTGSSLLQRSAWVDKACELRGYAITGARNLAKQVSDLLPEYQNSLHEIKFIKERKDETSKALSRGYRYYAQGQEVSELDAVSDSSLVFRVSDRSLKGTGL